MIIRRIQEALWRKFNKLKPFFSGNEELTAFQKRLKEMLLHQRANHADQKQQLNREKCMS